MDVAHLETSQKDSFADAVATILQVYIDDTLVTITKDNIETFVTIIKELRGGLSIVNNAEQMNKISTIETSLLGAMVEAAYVGGEIETSTADGLYKIQKNVPCNSVQGATSSPAPVIDFGTDICNDYGPIWSSSSDTDSHFGVGIATIYYEDGVDFQSQLIEDQNSLASRILLVTIANPDTGSELSIQSLSDPISVTIPITQQSVTYECKFWDKTREEWSTDGVQSNTDTQGVVTCQTTHLSIFAVFTGDDPLPTTTMAPWTGTAALVTARASSLFQGKFTRTELIIFILGLALFSLLLLVFLIVACILIVKLAKRHQHRNRPQSLRRDGHGAETGSALGSHSSWLSGSNRVTPFSDDDEIQNQRHSRTARRSHSSWFSRSNSRVTPFSDDDEIRNQRHSRASTATTTCSVAADLPRMGLHPGQHPPGHQSPSRRRPPHYSMQKARPIWMP
ncbi:uncharacterized protein [Amphiura filiformis]|uniref:uncharacterized protein n=1 Tax=Amphiura filiformis TaxID=82378 RepID=UPI003B21CA3D